MAKTVYMVHACDDWGAHIGIAGIYSKKSIAIEHILEESIVTTISTDSNRRCKEI